jgi:hypothetical protein
MTYDDLVANTPIWLYAQNRSIVDEMPVIISDAEDQLYQRFDHDLFQTVLTGFTLTAGDPVIDLTAIDDLLEVRAIRLTYQNLGVTSLERRDLEMASMLYAQNRPGRPRFYAEYGSYDVLKVFPTPSVDVTYEITCNVMPPRLGPSQQSNIIIEKFPRAIERSVFRQGALFMKNQADAATYGQEADDALLEANMAIARRRRDNTATRPVETANTRGA